MRILILYLTLLLVTSACQPDMPGDIGTPAPQATASVEATNQEQSVVLTSDNFTMRMARPEAWESFTTEYGVVMGEAFGSVATGGELKGVMAYVFASPLSEFDINVANLENENFAHVIQSRIVADPSYVGKSVTTAPVSFEWDGRDASYYLVRDDELGINTMVLAMLIDESQVLLTMTISAPFNHSDRIREALPEMLREFEINNSTIAGNPLDLLPDPLIFPAATE